MRERTNPQFRSPSLLLAVACAFGVLSAPALTRRAAAAEASRTSPLAIDTASAVREALHCGDFERFVELARESSRFATGSETDPALVRLQVEALLSVGKNGAADTMAASALLANERLAGPAARAQDELLLKQWLTARWRQGRPLDEAWLERRCGQANTAGSPTLSAAAFWREALGVAAPYRFVGSPIAAPLPLQTAAEQRLNSAQETCRPGASADAHPAWVAIEINQVRLPRALIDTGSQHTLISSAAATAAGVEFAAEPFSLTGFAPFSARPGIIRKLDLGGLSIADVPVLVGDSPTLREAGGQAALGIDLLSHLRVVLDYPARQMIVTRADPSESASEPPISTISPVSTTEQSVARIPLWTFSYAVLAQGQLSDQRYARTLIDTGAWSGAYVSTAWADDRARGLSTTTGRLVSRRRQARRLLADWRIGELRLTGGSVRGMLPNDLERLDAFDVLVGHEAIAGRRVEIDLMARRLTLSAGKLSDVKTSSSTESSRLND